MAKNLAIELSQSDKFLAKSVVMFCWGQQREKKIIF